MENFLKICAEFAKKIINGVEKVWTFGLLALTFIAVGLMIFIGPDKAQRFLDDIKSEVNSQPTAIPTSTSLTSHFMKLTSPAFNHSGSLPSEYTCDGKNMSPPFQIAEAPSGTKSFAFIVDDPDAPSGDWVHWLVWNIAPETTTIAEGTVPPGAIQGTTDFGDNKWGGPCPPSGVHRYQFKLYALDSTLGLPETATKKELEKAIAEHTLDQTTMVGLYQKN